MLSEQERHLEVEELGALSDATLGLGNSVIPAGREPTANAPCCSRQLQEKNAFIKRSQNSVSK